MKTKWFALLGVLFLAFTFVACSGDDDVSSSNLIGTWELEWESGWYKEDGKIVEEWDEEAGDIRVHFYDDGTWDQEEYYGKKWYNDGGGIWKLKGSKLTLYDDDFEDGWDEAESANIVTLNNTTLILEHADKEVDDGVTCIEYNKQTYRRISE